MHNNRRSRTIHLPSFRAQLEDDDGDPDDSDDLPSHTNGHAGHRHHDPEKFPLALYALSPAWLGSDKRRRRKKKDRTCSCLCAGWTSSYSMFILRFPVPTSLSAWLKILTPILCLAFLIHSFFDVALSLDIYRRSWIKQNIEHIEPLRGCFNDISPHYNLTLARAPKHVELHPGTALRYGFDCYHFAGLIPREPLHYISRTIYHTYWRADLLPFSERQVWTLKSFFATQNLDKSVLILWSNGDLGHVPAVSSFLKRYPQSFELRVVDVDELARGTALEGSPNLQVRLRDEKAWVDGDLVRLLVVWHHGGVWLDMDSLLTRDLAPLLEHEFVTQWDCFDQRFLPLNGAVLHFHRRSPYLCEAFHIMATEPPPAPNSIDWGSRLYHKLYRRLLNANVEPFKILPWCFIDGANCGNENKLPDPLLRDGSYWGSGRTFEEGGPLDDVVSSKIFSVHLHNRWEKPFPRNGWVERLLLRRYNLKLGG